MYEQNVLLRSYKSFKHTFNHALLESKISGTMSFAQWWVLDLTSETLFLYGAGALRIVLRRAS